MSDVASQKRIAAAILKCGVNRVWFDPARISDIENQPIVATLGAGGATAATLDSLLVHPAVVAACNAVNGTPASATVVSPPVTEPANPPAAK